MFPVLDTCRFMQLAKSLQARSFALNDLLGGGY